MRRRYRGVIATLAWHRRSLGSLAEAFDHFRKVTSSYWPGLFRCHDINGPATDEQRPGAVFRLLSLPRVALQRSEGGLSGDGGARLGAAGGCGGDATAIDRGEGPDPVRPLGMVRASGPPRAASGRPDAGPPLPPRAGGILQIA